MSMEDALAHEIRIELTRQSMHQQTLADLAGMGRATLNRYLQGHKSMTMGTFFRLAEALQVSPSVLMKRAADTLG
jgi:transcriptional regulator with XRE-family HTH domain